MATENASGKYSHKESPDWIGKISNHQQIGGVETSTLNNGSGKGVRMAWINTGSGLRFKVVLDRGMDIAEAFYNKNSIAWISHIGITPPDPSVNSGTGWLNSFGGGLLTTCGLTHIGGPEKDDFGERGLHDRISHIPAVVESIIQPDIRNMNTFMSITGRMIQSTVFGPHLELKRTISSHLGSSVINISDEVTNLGNEPAPHMLLYHFNFGWPLVDDGSKISWNGKWQSRGSNTDNLIFNANSDFKICKNTIDAHTGSGESAAFIDVDPDNEGLCECSLENKKIPLKVNLKFSKEQLPWLINWQHFGRNEYVTALEPSTHQVIGQSAARKNKTLLFLQPGEKRFYNIDIEITSDNSY